MAKSPAWQRKEGKKPYRWIERQRYELVIIRRTGGNLKAPSKKEGNKRRASLSVPE